MAFPVILQKLFQNSGAGSLLNRSIIPAANGTELGGVILSDTAGSEVATDGIAATPAGVAAAVAAALTTLSAVSYSAQTLTTAQKEQARANIAAAVNTVAPVGSFLCFAGNTVPAGYLLCNGAAVSRETYAALFAVIGTLYGAGDGSTTFNLPNCDGRVLQGVNDLTKVGQLLDSQLPNIIGQVWGLTGTFSGGSPGSAGISALYWVQANWQYAFNNGTAIGYRDLNFSASRNNAIYGAYTRVQNPALQSLIAIRYA